MELTLPQMVIATGTSSGLGVEVTRLLLDSGTVVIGVDPVPPPDELSSLSSFTWIEGGMQESATWDAVRARMADSQDRTIGYAAIAATLVQGMAHELGPVDWERAFSVNVVGSTMGLVAVRERMLAQGGGQAVFVGSVNATFGEEAIVAYNASKGALRQVVRSCALDYGPEGIRVNMVSPGPMLTEMFLKHLHSSPDPESMMRGRQERQPLGHITYPIDVAHAVTFLLSNEARGISGADIVVDGGLTASFEFRHIPMKAS